MLTDQELADAFFDACAIDSAPRKRVLALDKLQAEIRVLRKIATAADEFRAAIAMHEFQAAARAEYELRALLSAYFAPPARKEQP